MTAADAPVSTALEQDLRAVVTRKHLVLWLDAAGHYTPFVDHLIAQRTAGALPYEVKAFRGSHLELMLALEHAASGVNEPALVVHLPRFNEDTVAQSPMLELYRAGHCYRKALPTLVKDAAAGIATPEDIDALVRQPDLTLAHADRWLANLAASSEDGTRGQLRLLSLPALVDALRTPGKGLARAVDEDRATRPAVWQHLRATTGITDEWREAMRPSNVEETAEDIATAVASWAMVVEYVHDLRHERPPRDPRLAAVRLLPSAVRNECGALAKHLRRSEPEFYRLTALETERELVDERTDARAEDLGRIDTFEFEEQCVYEAALAALKTEQWDRALGYVHDRLEGEAFWIDVRDSYRRPAWELVHAMARLGRAIADAGHALEAKSLPEAVQRYVARGAAVDQAHRELEQQGHVAGDPSLPKRDILLARLGDLRRRWYDWADRWARDFSVLCRTHGFLPPPPQQQRMLFDDVVRPLTEGKGTTVIFMVDALRFEMAQALMRELGPAGAGTTVDLQARLCELPSTTEVGMNALAPVVDRGRLRLSLRSDRKKVDAIVRGEYRVEDPESRRRTMHDRVGGPRCPKYTLDEVLDKNKASLTSALAGAKLCVVHVEEIDAAGERGSGPIVFEPVLKKIRRAYNLLREAKAQRFVLTADHGFLLLHDGVRTAQSHGRKIDPHRRHVFSTHAVDHPDEVRVPLAQLDYDGVDDLQLMMPEGIAVFDLGKRRLPFVHGGNSLQERVIPVLTITHAAAGSGGDPLTYRITAAQRQGLGEYHCIAVKVQVAGQHALGFGTTRRVALELEPVGSADVRVELFQARGEATVRGDSILATIDGDFELFFRLLGPTEGRVRVRLRHPFAELDVEPCTTEEHFAVAKVLPPPPATDEPPAIEPTTAPTPTAAPEPGPAAAAPSPPTAPADDRSWLDAFTNPGERELFEHLFVHGQVDEIQATRILGSARLVRRFSNRFDELKKKAPFEARSEQVGGVKRYIRQG